MSHEPLCEMLDDLARFHHSDVSIAAEAADLIRDLSVKLEDSRAAVRLLCEASGVPLDTEPERLARGLRVALRQRDNYEGWLTRIADEQPPAIDDHSVWALRALRGEEAP
jgi:hypothetical protein